MHFVGNSLYDLYGQLLDEVSNGTVAAPRGQKVSEAHGPQMWTIKDPSQWAVPIHRRKFNPFFALAEVVWMWSGKGGSDFITFYNSNLSQFLDAGLPYFHGSYGRRVRHYGYNEQPFRELPSPRTHTQNPVDVEVDQLEHVVAKLQRDPQTRQAVVVLWDPIKDNFVQSKDHPCNNMIYFSLREGRLDMTVVRRSNDLIWGVPYNMCQFAHLQALMAGELEVSMGDYHVIANNLHFYHDLYPDQLQLVNHWAYGLVDRVPVHHNAMDMTWPLSQFTHFVTHEWDPLEMVLRRMSEDHDSDTVGPAMNIKYLHLTESMMDLGVPAYWQEVFTVLFMFHLRKNGVSADYAKLRNGVSPFFRQLLPKTEI